MKEETFITTNPQLAVYEENGSWHWKISYEDRIGGLAGHGFATAEGAWKNGKSFLFSGMTGRF